VAQTIDRVGDKTGVPGIQVVMDALASLNLQDAAPNDARHPPPRHGAGRGQNAMFNTWALPERHPHAMDEEPLRQ
jgi:hypothetical protein